MGKNRVLTLGLATLAFTIVFLGNTAIHALNRESPHVQPVGVSILDRSTIDREMSIDHVSTTAFGTSIGLEIALPYALEDGASPGIDQADFHVVLGDGSKLDIASWLTAVNYTVASDRRAVGIEFQGAALDWERASELTLQMDAFYIVPPGGDGIRISGPWTVVAQIRVRDVPGERAVSGGARRLDTGFGWTYVIDEVRADALSVSVTYHVEGATSGLVPVPWKPERGNNLLLPQGVPTQTVVLARDSSEPSFDIYFGAGARWTAEPIVVTLSRTPDGWVSGTGSVAGTPISASVEASTQADGSRYTTIAITSALALNMLGSEGQGASLTDEAGNSYSLYHGSGTVPPSVSRWDFEGAVADNIQRLTFTLPGYARLEAGDWSLTLQVE
ncbi:MAG: hypothetical protein R3B97_11340 [Dehalococcoidia bacterium]|nr:hypothetical protein [Dehalococcoidia bacterium]MCB9484544.1 hypothetical protein [Thermoflexaceae bacterium]